MTVPQSVKEAIGRRLNRLSKDCLDTLHLAAALGKTFEFRELAAVSEEGEEALVNALEEAETAQLIRSQPGESFAFTHDKIREVLYSELLSIRRRRLHQRIGEGLLRLYTPDLEPHAQELAHHFIESGDLEKGLQFACSAAQQATKIYAHDEAVLYYHRAAECAEALNRIDEQTSIAEAIGDIYYNTGPFETAIEAYQHALNLADSPVKRAELGAKIGATFAKFGDERGVAYLKVSLEQLDPLTQVETKARALAMLGRFHHYRGQGKKAIEYLEEARLLAEPLGEPDLLTDIYSYLCGAYQWTGQYKQSNEWAQRTLEYGEQINFPNAIALGYEFLAENAFIRGEWLDSLAFAARDREIGEKIGSQDRVGWSEMSTAFAYHALGELSLGLAAANRGAELAQAIGNTRLEVIVRAWRAQIACDLGDEPQLRTDLDFILNQAGRSQQYQMYDWSYNTLCYVHAMRREWTELLESVEKYEEYTQRRHENWNMLAYLGLGMLQEATQSSEEYHSTPRNTESIVDQAYYWFIMARYEQAFGRVEAALQAYTLSIQFFTAQGARLDHARTLVWRAELLISQGQDDLGRADLVIAQQIFQACGARPDLERAERLLAQLDIAAADTES